MFYAVNRTLSICTFGRYGSRATTHKWILNSCQITNWFFQSKLVLSVGKILEILKPKMRNLVTSKPCLCEILEPAKGFEPPT